MDPSREGRQTQGDIAVELKRRKKYYLRSEEGGRRAREIRSEKVGMSANVWQEGSRILSRAFFHRLLGYACAASKSDWLEWPWIVSRDGTRRECRDGRPVRSGDGRGGAQEDSVRFLYFSLLIDGRNSEYG